MKKFVSKCPVCETPLEIVELRCPSCGTVVRGNFPIDRFLQLDDDDKEFVIEFLKSRGNIRELQNKFSISYPTAKARLDKILVTLGLYEDEKGRVDKMEILDKIEKGEISVDEALKILRGLK